MTRRRIPLADAKARLSELVVRAAFGGEEFLITRRGKPAALLAPARPRSGPGDLADVRGWLPADDPFFGALADARRASRERGPRILR